jgi:hypothetical protein
MMPTYACLLPNKRNVNFFSLSQTNFPGPLPVEIESEIQIQVADMFAFWYRKWANLCKLKIQQLYGDANQLYNVQYFPPSGPFSRLVYYIWNVCKCK